MKVTGNTILITGGASGIGLELCKQLLARQNKIIITGRDQKKLDQAKKLFPEIHTIQNDVAKPRDLGELHEKVTRDFPETNILINNAGIMRTLNLHTLTDSPEELTKEIEINLCGPIRLSKLFLAHLKAKPSAAIVNVTSGLAFVPLPSSPVYCATKAGLHSFTCSLRVQLKKTNVKVFELAPPATETELLVGAAKDDLKGVTIMKVEAMVAAGIKGIERDCYEIRPGQSNQLKLMSRLAPEFILKQLSGPAERMITGP